MFFETPWYSDDTLINIVSGSFDKNTFRTIVGNSPFSSSLIPSFDKDNYTPNNNYPDYVVKTATQDSSIQTNKIGFYTYNSTSSSYQNAVDSGSLIEEYIVHSGSYKDGQSFLGVGKIDFMLTPEKIIVFGDRDAGKDIKLKPTKTDSWDYISRRAKTSASGSLIKMYDGSTKQVQDVAAGDIVKSYLPVGMPDEFSAQDWIDYSTTSLDGSTMSGSVVVRTFESEAFGYMLVNGSIKIPYSDQAMHKGIQYFTKIGDTWSWKKPDEGLSVGNYFLNSSEEEVEITSISEVSQSVNQYSLDVEDIDTYFQSDIVVHNLPPK